MKCPYIILTIGLCFILISLLLPTYLPLLVKFMIASKIVLRPSASIMEKFTQPPAEMYLKVWFFNISNPDDVMKGHKAVLDEVGPYTYRQVRMKEDLQFNTERGTVEFNNKKVYFFEPDLSSGYETDVITTVNALFMSLAKATSGSRPRMAAVQVLFTRHYSRPLVTKMAGELLFHGYKEPLVETIYNVSKKEKYKAGRFGFLYPKNGSLSKRFEIYTGEKGMHNYQSIYKFNGKEELPYWKERRCNMLNGSDGSQYPRPLVKKRIYLFSEDLCRSIYAEFEKEVYHGNLKLHRYTLPSKMLANSSENSCFCTTKMTCRSSMIDVSPCKDGAPIVISTPHYYQGPPEDRSDVIGLNPMKDAHETFLDIEPTLGATLRADKRIQINVIFKRYGNYPLLQNIREVIMPILWVSDSATVEGSKANKIHDSINRPKVLVWHGSIICFFLGVTISILGCIRLCKLKEIKSYRTKL